MSDAGTGVAARLRSIDGVARAYLRSEFLYERAERIGVLAAWVCGFPELAEVACNRTAVQAAVWLQDAWCVEEVAADRLLTPLVLATPMSDRQREKSADVAQALLKGVVDEATRETAAKAIRLAGVRDTNMPEAIVLAEASNLDAMGPLWLWGQIAKSSAEDKAVGSFLDVWERQIEYLYWARRIADTLRFAKSRELAKRRCSALETFFLALRAQLDGSDRHGIPEATE